jgi:predicted permease
MLKNYIKIAWRNLWKSKGFSAINIIGLALGMMAFTIIALWIQSEVTYDRFYTTTDRLSEVYTADVFEGERLAWGETPAVLAPILKQNHPEIEEVTRTSSLSNLLYAGDNRITASGLSADSSFFKLFDFQFIEGDRESSIANPNSIVITESLAKKLFGKTAVLGETLQMDTLGGMMVTGVLEDIPQNSRFSNIEYVTPWTLVERLGLAYTSWTAYNHETFVLLKAGVSLGEVNKRIADLVKTQTNGAETATIFLHPANQWHLYNKSVNGQMVAGRIKTLRLFASVGLFILLIACVNFVNLSTARGEKRAKEVGIRKVVGAPRKSLISQFLIESIMIAFFAAVISWALVVLTLPIFNQIMAEHLVINFGQPLLWLFFLFVILFTGALAGIYPAFFLSAYMPMKTLKGIFIPKAGTISPRKVLVVLQFAFSIGLVICTLIISRQIQYVQERDNGYEKENLIYISLNGELKKNYSIFRNELINQGVAVSVNKSSGPISRYNSNSWGYEWSNSKPEDYDVVFNTMSTDADFVRTMGVTLLDGRDIDISKYPSDSTAVLLNESALKRMGLKSPIGAEIYQSKGSEYEQVWHVVGVIKDFILTSPYEDVEPLFVFGPASWFSYMHIRLNPENSMSANLDAVKAIIKKYNPNYPVDFVFVDEDYAKKFSQQQRIGNLTTTFSVLAIVIACLGLLGLITNTVQQHSKEIGIRKVLGASVVSIVQLLSRDFVKLVLIAIVIASPIAWWAMDKWLQDFSYRIDIKWWMFALAGMLAVVIALLTVSFQAIKAAVANPVDSLRDE